MRAYVRIKAVFTAAVTATIAGGLLAAPALAAPAATAAAGHATAAQPAKLPLSAARLRADRMLHTAGASGLTSITGQARAADGTLLSGICVSAAGLSGHKSAVTGRDGRFTISGLRPGSYQVEYSSCAGSARKYLPEWYGSVFERGEAQSVVVTGSTLAPVQSLGPVTMYPADSSLSNLPAQIAAQHRSVQQASAPFGRLATAPSSPAALIASVLTRDGLQPPLASAGAAATAGHGRIAGTVTSPGGHGLKGICIEAVRQNGPGFGFATSGKAGAYRITRLPAGKYVLIFYADCGNTGNWLFQIYKNIYNPARKPTLVRVTSGRAAAINAVMKEGGEISGSVTGPGGRKLSGICAYPLTNSYLGFLLAGVSRDGAYHIRSLRPGRYQIGFASCGGSSVYAPTLWPDTQNYKAAPYIRISGARDVGNIDEVMQRGGIITGVVTAATTPPTPLSGICVYVNENNGLYEGASATTGAGGSYQINGLAAGSYSVQFQTGCGNNGNYINASYPRDVAVTNGVTSGGINGSLPVGVTISGAVTSAASGQPLRGVCVSIEGITSSSGYGFTQTGPAGTYSVDQLPAGAYQAIFTAGCGSRGSYAPQAYNDTNVLEPQTIDAPAAGQAITGISAAMQPGPVITGTVTSTSGSGLSGICVLAATPGGVLFGVSQTRHGRYSLPDLDPGLYQVIFEPGCGNNADLALQAFRSDETGADPVSAVSGTVSGINAVMQPAGAISGHVRTASGRPVQLSCITLTGVSGRARSQAGEAFVFGSSYKLSGLPAGGYQVTFTPSCANSTYAAQWYKDKPAPGGAATVRVSAFRTTAGIDSALVPGGSIAGHVTSGGKAVRGMCVYAQNVTESQAYGLGTSNRSGNYTIRGLNSGDYELQLFPCATGSAAVAEIIAPRLVHVTAPHRTSGVTTSVPAGATIAGTVLGGTPASGPGAAGACVEAFSLNQAVANSTSAGLDGTFSITNLPPGQYQVYVGDPGCSFSYPDLAPAWYLNSPGEAGATTVTVSPGGTTTLSDSTLRTDGSVSGTVTAAGGGALPGICVAAIPVGLGTTPVYSVSGSTGSYAIGDLPAGHYRVQFSSGCDAAGYRTQWWHGRPTRPTATILTVTSGAATTGIDAAMQK